MKRVITVGAVVAASGILSGALMLIGTRTASANTGQSGSTATSTDSAKSSQPAKTTTPARVAFVTYFRGPYPHQIELGAKAAAAAYGAHFQYVGPASSDAPKEISDFKVLVNEGVKGIVLIPEPPSEWVPTINWARSKGVVVDVVDIASPTSKENVVTAYNPFQLGTVMAQQVSKAIGGPKAKGLIPIGTCVPGNPAVANRISAFEKTMNKLSPKVTFSHPYDTTLEKTSNYSAWKNIVNAHPNAPAYTDFCVFALQNLVHIERQESSIKGVIGSFGLTLPNVKAVEASSRAIDIALSGWVEGYMSTKLVLQHLVDHKPLPQGKYLNTGYDLIVHSNASKYVALATDIDHGDNAAIKKFYNTRLTKLSSEANNGKYQSMSAFEGKH